MAVVKPDEPLPHPAEGKQKAISVGDMIRRLQASAQRMGPLNPNKVLMMNAAYALQQLVDRLEAFENPKGRVQ